MRYNFRHIANVISLPLCFAGVTLTSTACGQSNKNTYSDSDSVCVDEVIVAEDFVDSEFFNNSEEIQVVEPMSDEELAAIRYKMKYDEVHNADIHLMYADGKKIFYNHWIPGNDYGYDNKMHVYDSESDTDKVINLNKTNLDDDSMYVEGMVEHNGIITIIMSEMRNSNGWLDGTYVWQYNCKTGSWKPLARGCSGAEFVNNRNSVRINNAECLNPDDPTFLQEYRNHYKTIKL